jgi:hypothetical protein
MKHYREILAGLALVALAGFACTFNVDPVVTVDCVVVEIPGLNHVSCVDAGPDSPDGD